MKRIILLILIAFIHASVYAFQWESKNLHVLSTDASGEILLKDEKEREFTIINYDSISEKQVERILKLTTVFHNFQTITINSSLTR